jgi:large subunit ribosomal protein L18
MAKKDKAAVRRAVHTRIRRRVRGTQERPRLAIFRSLNHVYAQVIDDERAVTIASASTVEKDLRGTSGGNIEAAQRVGRAIAERTIAKGVEQVVFDRGGFRFHGRIKALVDAAREAGLNKNERAEEADGEGGAEAAA